MKPRPPLPEGPFLVVGLERSGVAVALALQARGEEVIGCDAGSPAAEGLSEAGVEVHLQTSGTELAARARTLIKSPGVPHEAPVIAAARQRGLPVMGELEIAWRLIPNEFIAVTGTNGKTTTTELIGHIHREAGAPVAVAGNVGTAASTLADSGLPAGATVVCETSSYQLEDTVAFAPEAALLLNLRPEHLDRHGTLEAYTAAKLQAFARQGNDDLAVAPTDLGIEDLGGCGRRVCFGPDGDLVEREDHLWWLEEPLLRTEEIRLRGAHNVRNAMAAAATTLARGLDRDAVVAGLKSFAGVPHRLEEIATVDGVLYVNDSKATNVDSTLVALEAFGDAPVHLILGGRAKPGGFKALREALAQHARAVYVIGEAAQEIQTDLLDAPFADRIVHAQTLDEAVADARAAARPGEVVLLSPAAASFDQYRDFEARGEHFRALVEAERA